MFECLGIRLKERLVFYYKSLLEVLKLTITDKKTTQIFFLRLKVSFPIKTNR